MPEFVSIPLQGSSICLYQRKPFLNGSYRKRGLLPAGFQGRPFQLVQHTTNTTRILPSPAGPPGSRPLNPLYLLIVFPISAGHHTGIRYNCYCQHLLQSRFLPGAVHKRSKFANFCHDLMQNHLS